MSDDKKKKLDLSVLDGGPQVTHIDFEKAEKTKKKTE